MALRQFGRRNFSLASTNLQPLKKSDPEAGKAVYVNNKRVFPPTLDENGNITYYYEWPADWKPYSYNYRGHGWLFTSQVLLWFSVFYYDHRMKLQTEKEREH